ncbi:MAG TPA: hypothetical protein VF026_04260, partial [Ktedonobacteraceae bacterium]
KGVAVEWNFHSINSFVLLGGAIMSLNNIMRIAEHPRRADQPAMWTINRVHDKPAPTDARMHLFICIIGPLLLCIKQLGNADQGLSFPEPHQRQSSLKRLWLLIQKEFFTRLHVA